MKVQKYVVQLEIVYMKKIMVLGIVFLLILILWNKTIIFAFHIILTKMLVMKQALAVIINKMVYANHLVQIIIRIKETVI